MSAPSPYTKLDEAYRHCHAASACASRGDAQAAVQLINQAIRAAAAHAKEYDRVVVFGQPHPAIKEAEDMITTLLEAKGLLREEAWMADNDEADRAYQDGMLEVLIEMARCALSYGDDEMHTPLKSERSALIRRAAELLVEAQRTEWHKPENQAWTASINVQVGSDAADLCTMAVELGLAVEFTYTKPGEAPDEEETTRRIVVPVTAAEWGIRSVQLAVAYVGYEPIFGGEEPRSFRYDRMTGVRLVRDPRRDDD